MTQVGEGRSRAAADRLRAIADPDLYRHNPFRVLGLTTEAGAREVRQKRQAVLAALDLGARAPVNDKRLPLAEPPDGEDVRAAFDVLERADHRIVAELFWWWGAPGACGCDAEVHRLHDIAVEAHAKALDFEAAGGGDRATRGDLWTDAADAWVDALDEDRLWDHVRHRVVALSDRRLDESTVEGLKASLPGALLMPQALLARRDADAAELAGLMSTWDLDEQVIADARVFAATPLYERVTAEIKQVHDLLHDDRASEAAVRALRDLPGLGVRLEALVPHSRFRRSAKVRNDIAVALNNAGMALDIGGSQTELRLELLTCAQEFAVDPRDIAVIGQNVEDHRRARGTGRVPGASMSAQEWQQITGLIRSGNLDQARDRLESLREDGQLMPDEEARIDALLVQLSLSPLGLVVSPYTWFANVALYFGTLVGVTWLLGGVWELPGFLAGLGAVAATLAPLFVVYSSWYRRMLPHWLFVFAGTAGCYFVGRWAWMLFADNPEPLYWSLGLFVFGGGWCASIVKRALFGEVRMP